MELEKEFEEAQKLVKELSERPTNEELLKLYGLFKQATEGDVQTERPGGFDFKAQFKHDAWASLAGKSKEDAMTEYIELVYQLKKI
ncbi:acyl-CoA-binding protein [Flexithrix dorotheae]|uniref:acyl-CoA-binding protein n=1 Tax=Flexithrix dorotheae TaxID=70993 RepID=UPI00036754E4|nr:acyl-CoA-binding protein [Flexithrix dorotheae]